MTVPATSTCSFCVCLSVSRSPSDLLHHGFSLLPSQMQMFSWTLEPHRHTPALMIPKDFKTPKHYVMM